jgi:hypothetical protein
MGAMAAIVGAVGGLCLVLGLITITEVMPPLGDQFNWSFWSTLSIILLLASIALAVGRGGHD